jgi:hypothetical protein
MILCLLIESLDEAAVLPALLELAPRVALGNGGVVWVDARGVRLEPMCARLLARLRSLGAARVWAGAAAKPEIARLAAVGAENSLRVIGSGEERDFLAPQPLNALGIDAHTLALLEGVGVETLGQLGELPQEAVEVRFGGGTVGWWRLARGEDERRLFRPVPPEEPHASLDFIDYVVTDPERLLFTANALLGTICDQLLERGAHARRILLTLALGNGTKWERELKPARPTASRSTWLRLVRALLERLTVADAVAGVALQVQASEAASAVQGDLFDAGFATASAVEAAVARLLEEQGAIVVRPSASEHPLVDERLEFEPLSLGEATSAPPAAGANLVRERRTSYARRGGAAAPDRSSPEAARPDVQAPELSGDEIAPALSLQLLPQPRPVLVDTVKRRDHHVPVRYRDGQWRELVNCAGPARVSGGQGDRSYAREYFRAVTTDGLLVWLFRDACRDRWYLHGWWD